MPVGPTLVILGMMGRMPVAGVTWQVLHYLEGFRRLGFDAYYVEDTGEWSYDPDQNTISEDPTYAVNSILRSDYNAVMGFTVWAGTIFLAVNLLVDLAHTVVDPRERMS